MKIIIKQKEIEQCLNIASNVASKKVITPSLQGTLLTAKDQLLTLQSSDGEIFYSISIPAEVSEEGSVLVKTSFFHDIVKNCLVQSLEIETDETNVLKITGIGSKYNADLILLDQEEFPPFPEYSNSEPLISLEDKEFKEVILQTIPFASKDDMRLTFNSLYIEKDSLELRVISSDTKRLALARHSITNSAQEFSLLIPIKTALILKEMLHKNTQIHIALFNNMVLFKYDNMILISNQIAGSFPDYKAVIPAETPFVFKIDRAELSNILRTLSPYYNGDSQKLIMNISNDLLSLKTEKTSQGQGSNDIPIEYSSDNIEIVFNYNLFKEIVQHIVSQNLIIKILASDKPVLIQGETNGEPQDKALFVCVPMKL